MSGDGLAGRVDQAGATAPSCSDAEMRIEPARGEVLPRPRGNSTLTRHEPGSWLRSSDESITVC